VETLAAATTPDAADGPLRFLKRSCERGSGDACCALAGEYASGKWLPPDQAHAAELRARACELGRPACCAKTY
jgi:TPR repeat protein